jgi:hypothetical protein
MANSASVRPQPHTVSLPGSCTPTLLKVGDIHTYSDHRWIGCVRDVGGVIYLLGGKKTIDGGATVISHANARVDQLSVMYRPEGAAIARPGFFLALDGYVQYQPSSGYHVRTWHSTDNLKSIEEQVAPVNVPQLGNTPMKELFPISFARSLIEMPDGSLLATAQGCFEEDRLIPEDRQGQLETSHKLRTLLVVSHDQGASWHYHATIACPNVGDPVGEGFDEPTMSRLDDGRLLCIMRTGHYTPLYSCWSSDNGRTWTEPLYTGLERGCWPCLVKLADGRLALSYGQRFPAGWSRVTPQGDWARYEPIWPGVGLVKLAISPDGTGTSWVDTTVGRNMGSCYSTLFEVEPNLLFCQVDGWFWRMMLVPRAPEEL